MHMEQDTQMLVNMIMGLNPLEFRHLFGIYNVDSFHRMGVQICAHCKRTRERDCVVSSFACFSHPTTFNGNNYNSSNGNCYIRQLHMQALSHSSLLLAFLSLVNISLSLVFSVLCIWFVPYACLSPAVCSVCTEYSSVTSITSRVGV